MQLITIPDFEASGGFSQELTQDSSIVASQAGTAENLSSHLDEITVLVAQSGFAAKTLSRAPTGELATKSHSAGKMFRFLTYRISDILELGTLLDVIQENRRLLVIRGEPAKTLTPENPVQRLKKDFKTPARGRRWVMIDFDKIALPAGLGLHVDKSQAIEHVVHLLPQEFHGVSYYWQLSSRAGFTSNDTMSLHVWFWLDRPVPDEHLKAWGKALNEQAGFKLIDTALFNDVQQHYTSRPILKGLDDPFPVRSGLTTKDSGVVRLKLRKANPKRGPQIGQVQPLKTGQATNRGFEAILRSIGDHRDGQGFHEPIIRAVASYVATQDPQQLDTVALKAKLRDAICNADRSNHDDGYIEQMAGDEHLDAAIDSAVKKFSPAQGATRKPRKIEGIAPHYVHRELKRDTAAESLRTAVQAFFAI